MAIITGTSDFQALFQGLLSEVAIVDGQPYGVPIVKLTDDSNAPQTTYISSGTVLSFDFPAYAEWDYFGDAIYSGTNLYHCVFRRGGATGTILATIDCSYDESDNLLTVTRT